VFEQTVMVMVVMAVVWAVMAGFSAGHKQVINAPVGRAATLGSWILRPIPPLFPKPLAVVKKSSSPKAKDFGAFSAHAAYGHTSLGPHPLPTPQVFQRHWLAPSTVATQLISNTAAVLSASFPLPSDGVITPLFSVRFWGM